MLQQDQQNESEAQNSSVAQKKSNPQKEYATKQGKKKPIQAKNGNGKPIKPIQAKNGNGKPITPIQAKRGSILQRKGKSTGPQGLPAQMQANMEAMGGVDLSDVRVHRNSSKPAEIDAKANAVTVQTKQAPIQQKTEAFAQGSDIHLAPGMDKHLGHEAWHVVQQKQGRVQPTTSSGGVAINDSPQLEKEADDMGAKAVQSNVTTTSPTQMNINTPQSNSVQQKVTQLKKHKISPGEIDMLGMDSDSSYFEVTSTISAQGLGTGYYEYRDYPMYHASPTVLHGGKLGNSNEGTITIKSKADTLIDQNFGFYAQKVIDFVSTFKYETDRSGTIHVYKDYSTKDDDRHVIKGKNDNNYRNIKRVIPNATDSYAHNIALMSNQKNHTVSDEEKKNKKSITDFGFDIGGGAKANTKLHLKMGVNGEEVIMLFGGMKLFKGGLKGLQKLLGKYKWLKKIIDDEAWKELLKKQEISIQVDPEFHGKIESTFGYKYNNTTTRNRSEKMTTNYTSGGWMAEEVNLFKIAQKPSAPKKNILFEKENQVDLSDSEKKDIDRVMNKARSQGLLRKVDNDEYLIQLAGHASSSSSEKYNKGIAAKRIAAVRTYIMKNYDIIDKNQFLEKNYGEHQADQELISAGDRRVAISFVKKK